MLVVLVLVLVPVVLWASWELLDFARRRRAAWLVLGPADSVRADRFELDA